jgi:hypothetical protein
MMRIKCVYVIDMICACVLDNTRTQSQNNGLNTHIQNNKTPLHYAAQGGHVQATELLLAAGADYNAKDKVCTFYLF